MFIQYRPVAKKVAPARNPNSGACLKSLRFKAENRGTSPTQASKDIEGYGKASASKIPVSAESKRFTESTMITSLNNKKRQIYYLSAYRSTV
ncbi:MAG TPA: hypothetical protein DE036_03135 [Actinobacteria bacterium]|nr:hypothetical protein [Actinomycetota bacterium]